MLVLSCLAEAGLKIDPNKCKLLSEQVVVLGNAVSHDTYLRILRKYAPTRNGRYLPMLTNESFLGHSWVLSTICAKLCRDRKPAVLCQAEAR